MAESENHCPFLNRSDRRCGDHLRIDSLDHAFEHCFDVYAACPVYLEQLIERRTRGSEMAIARRPESMKKPQPAMPAIMHVSRIIQVQVRRSFAHQHAER